MNDELQLDLDLDDSLLQDQTVQTGSELFTNSSQQPDQEQASTEATGVRSMEQVYQDRIEEGRDPRTELRLLMQTGSRGTGCTAGRTGGITGLVV